MKKFVAILIVLLVLAAGAYGVYLKYMDYIADDFSDAKERLYIVGSRQSSETSLLPEQIQGLNSGLYYLSLEDLKTHFKVYGDYDDDLKRLRLFKNGQRLELDQNTNTMRVEAESFKAEPLLMVGDQVFVALNGLESFLEISIIANAELAAMMVVEDNSGYALVEDYDSFKLYRDWSLKRERYSKPTGGLIPIESQAEGVKLISSKLIPYYLIKDIEKNIQYKPLVEQDQRLIFRDGEPIYLFWEYVGTKHPSTDAIGEMPGTNVTSPTWMTLETGEGAIQLNYSESYVNWAKGRNLDVWPLVTNDFDPAKTSVLLHSMANRDAFISNLITFLEDKSMKGVNIDFENIYLADQDLFTSFMAELVYSAHQKGIIVSIDVTVPEGSDNWSLVFDRQKLGELVDYMMVMTYDQYWASSPISGTVAGITWVEANIKKMLALVPKEKLILGIPLYTRIWTETISKTQADVMDTKSKAITMKRAQEIIAEKKLTPIWDEKNGQNYVSYFEGDTLVKIWIEDLRSLALKAQLANTYELAGVACWRRGFELPEAWLTIQKAQAGE